VKPAPFAYHRPEAREEVDDLLARFGGEAKVLAGGQSLVPLLNTRLATPSHVIDVNRLRDEASEPVEDGDGLSFGPLVRHDAALRSPAVAERAPLLRDAVRNVGHPAIRSRGTVVGSVAHGDPAAEIPAVLVLLQGTVAARSARGRRAIPAGQFFLGPLQTALEEDEWVDAVGFPAHPPGAGFAFEEFSRRSGDYALCGVAALASMDGSGDVAVSLGYLGMGPSPVRVDLPPVPEADVGGPPLEDAVAEATGAALAPMEDLHATAAYRRWLAGRLGTRAARAAAAGASGEVDA
jgi:carbon-monoxide dehydrogenase medium subunit